MEFEAVMSFEHHKSPSQVRPLGDPKLGGHCKSEREVWS